jgi:hypothetical protein
MDEVHRTGWVDLNSLIPADSGWVLENPQAINAYGQITGQGFINDQYHAFVLRAMREPRRHQALTSSARVGAGG